MHEGKLQVLISLLLIITTKANPTTVVVDDLEYVLYKFDGTTGKLGYSDANAACVNIGGELAIINTEAIQNVIQPLLQTDAGTTSWEMGYWIGGYCSDNCKVAGGSVSNKQNWKWSDGSEMYDKYTNWYSTYEPNGVSNVGAYVYNFYSMQKYPNTFGAWGDDDGNNPMNYICQIYAACYPNPCKNGGTCQHTPSGSYTCHCVAGFGEKYCATDYCNPNSCQNGGTCTRVDGGYKCDCTLGVIGTSCQTDLCASDPCDNGGTCIGTNGSYYCDCPIGVIGTNCSTDFCASTPCQNGATCIGVVGGYFCNCPVGVMGTNCETDLCSGNPCENGGTYIGIEDGFTCDCPHGFVGTRCETDLCANNPCKNGGKCIGIDGGFKCNCMVGYIGAKCERGYCIED
uniref:protein jagged-2-like n=1 Tax=Ciona intestinalis TaxID=7719 RepID=UPI0002B8DA26|nr:protein jagged-2-like [Ciona intestinalis]|eukprot:XP_004227564.1 protein jagged-2-like [Ciona intestinalis]